MDIFIISAIGAIPLSTNNRHDIKKSSFSKSFYPPKYNNSSYAMIYIYNKGVKKHSSYARGLTSRIPPICFFLLRQTIFPQYAILPYALLHFGILSLFVSGAIHTYACVQVAKLMFFFERMIYLLKKSSICVVFLLYFKHY